MIMKAFAAREIVSLSKHEKAQNFTRNHNNTDTIRLIITFKYNTVRV